MDCWHCGSALTTEPPERTELDYRRFRCHGCQRECNERTGTLLSRLQCSSDGVCLVAGRGEELLSD